MTETKICSVCGTDKPRSEFRKSVRQPDGRMPYCKACTKEGSELTRKAKSASQRKAAGMVSHEERRMLREQREAEKAAARTEREAQAKERRELVEAGLKRCTKCGEVKLLDQFSLRLGSPRGQCKTCVSTYAKAHHFSTYVPKPASIPPEPAEHKFCRTCREVKPFTEFGSSATGRYGLLGSCKSCTAARMTPEQREARNKKRVERSANRTPEQRDADNARARVTSARARANMSAEQRKAHLKQRRETERLPVEKAIAKFKKKVKEAESDYERYEILEDEFLAVGTATARGRFFDSQRYGSIISDVFMTEEMAEGWRDFLSEVRYD